MSVTRLYQNLWATARLRALERPARRHERSVAPIPETWPVPRELRERLLVRWPVTYEWPLARKWVDGIRGSLARKLSVVPAEIAQPYEGAVMIEVELDGISHEVAIDYFDGERVLDEVVERCPLVFKMQYRSDGYGYPHVVPGGYVPGRPHIYRYLPGLRYLRDQSPAQFDVYGRFGVSQGPEIRRAAVELLRAQPQFGYEGSLKLLPYPAYLREAALSRVCVDLPGRGDMCHRLIDYLAVGCCIVRPEPQTRLHVPLSNGVNIWYVRPDLSDLVDTCARLASEVDLSAATGLAARGYFDRYLHVDQLAGYYVDRCASIL